MNQQEIFNIVLTLQPCHKCMSKVIKHKVRIEGKDELWQFVCGKCGYFSREVKGLEKAAFVWDSERGGCCG